MTIAEEFSKLGNLFYAKAVFESLREDKGNPFVNYYLSFYSPYIWNAQGLSRKEKWLLTILYFLSDAGKRPICFERQYIQLAYKVIKPQNLIGRLILKGYLKRGRKRCEIFFPHVLESPSRHWFWELKLTYKQLGMLYWLLSTFRRHITKGLYLTRALLYSVFSQTFPNELTIIGFYKAFRECMEAYTNSGLLVLERHHRYRRLFRLSLLRDLPFELRDIPQAKQVSHEEYGLYVDLYFNKLKDNSIFTLAIPERKAHKTTDLLLESLVQKGMLIKATSRTFVVV